MSLTEYLRPRLFDPLGVGAIGWIRDASGREIGYSGMYAATEAVAALGQLYLQGGRRGERQLLLTEWVAEASRRQVSTELEENIDWAQGYGYQFWMARHGYRGDGAFGQFCLILPEHDAVMAITAQTEDMQGVLELVWRHLLPALGGPGSAASEQRSPNSCPACDYRRCPVHLPRPMQHGKLSPPPPATISPV